MRKLFQKMRKTGLPVQAAIRLPTYNVKIDLFLKSSKINVLILIRDEEKYQNINKWDKK